MGLKLSAFDKKEVIRKLLYSNLALFEVIDAFAEAYDHKTDKDTKEYFYRKCKQLNLISCQVHKTVKDFVACLKDDEKIILQKYHKKLVETHKKLNEEMEK